MLDYLDGAIAEALFKARRLKAKIPGASTLLPDFEQLVMRAETEIDDTVSQLLYINEEPAFRDPANIRQKVLLYKQQVDKLSILENVVVAALARSHDDDAYVNQLVRAICREVNYPVRRPVASCLSRTYYHIYSEYGLMCMPLLESDFLLHIADIYHELCHPLLQLDNPKLEQFQRSLGLFNALARQHFTEQIAYYARNTERQDVVDMQYVWSGCWRMKWSIEFYCDLFGLYTLGPAYTWSNLHLCVKNSNDVYDVPLFEITSHPPDEARMQALFYGLDLLGYNADRYQIEVKWDEFKKTMQFQKQAEYDQAVPDILLEQVAVSVYDAVKNLGCRLALPGKQGPIATMLNEAWTVFWQNPAEFPQWEQQKVNDFKASIKLT